MMMKYDGSPIPKGPNESGLIIQETKPYKGLPIYMHKCEGYISNDPKAISACNLGYSGSLIIKMYPDNAISACNLGHSGSSLNKSSENVLLNRLSLYKLYVQINTQTT